MAEILHPKKIGTRRKKTKSTRQKPSSASKPTTLHYESYAVGDIAKRHPRAARGLFLFAFALLSIWAGPKIWNATLDIIWPERAYMNDVLIWHQMLCTDIQDGVIQVRQTVCDAETGCSQRQGQNLIIEAHVNSKLAMMCENRLPDPGADVDDIFVAMRG